jgi:hypothetical protein
MSLLKQNYNKLKEDMHLCGLGYLQRVNLVAFCWGLNRSRWRLVLLIRGIFFVSVLLRNKKDGFKWEVIVVYGPANHEKSEKFLEELQTKCEKTNVPMVLGGDFNLIRCQMDKNNRNVNWRLVKNCNDFIAEQQLQELK